MPRLVPETAGRNSCGTPSAWKRQLCKKTDLGPIYQLPGFGVCQSQFGMGSQGTPDPASSTTKIWRHIASGGRLSCCALLSRAGKATVPLHTLQSPFRTPCAGSSWCIRRSSRLELPPLNPQGTGQEGSAACSRSLPPVAAGVLSLRFAHELRCSENYARKSLMPSSESEIYQWCARASS